MHVPSLLCVALAVSVSAAAQTACSAGALPEAGKTVISLRHQLHGQAVGENDPAVPALIAEQLSQFKAALTAAADAAFSCASPTASPEALQKTLADALHANVATATETVSVTRDRKDLGAYGSDLSVQVFPLFNSPRYVEVDFRYGVECGDDNLLLVYGTGDKDSSAGTTAWRPVLHWGAPAYKTVSGAFGDFVLLTPLSGYPGQRNWRFVVAHGQPGCGGAASASHFDLDLLEPTADPAAPTVVWHLERPYRRDGVPRLSTTEDTLTFELNAPETATGGHAKSTPTTHEVLRYRVTRDNKVEAVAAESSAAPTGSASTRSPQ